MTTLSQLTQSRLSMLLLNKKNNTLLNKIPVYAEMSIIAELPPYTINERLEFGENEISDKQWLASRGFVLTEINNVIVANVDENDFINFPDKHKLYIEIIEKIKANLHDNDPLKDKRELINKIVLKILTHFEIATDPKPIKKAIYSYPLGTLSSESKSSFNAKS